MSINGEHVLVAYLVNSFGNVTLNAHDGELYGHISNASLGSIAGPFVCKFGLEAKDIMDRLNSFVAEYVWEANETLNGGV